MSYLPPAPPPPPPSPPSSSPSQAWPPPSAPQPWLAPPSWPTQPAPRRRRPAMVVGLALLVVGVLAAGLIVFTRVNGRGVAHPDQWDPRVVDIVHFVEMHRGLEFKHPVYVDFLSPDEYSQRARHD